MRGVWGGEPWPSAFLKIKPIKAGSLSFAVVIFGIESWPPPPIFLVSLEALKYTVYRMVHFKSYLQ